MNLERTQLYVNDVDLEPMPMQRHTAPGITGQLRRLKTIFVSSAEHNN